MDTKHYVEFQKNYVANRSYLVEYYRDYDPFIENRSLVIGLITLLAIYMVIGPIGNISIIGAIYFNKILWKPLNVFIINLSLADLVEVTIITSTSIVGLTIGHQVFLQNPRMCNIIANICVTSCVVSLLTHMTIAITRFLSIRHRDAVMRKLSWRRVNILCILIWIMAFFLQFGPNVGWGRNVFDLKQMICIWDRTYSIGYTLYFAIVFVFLPVSTILFCYIQLFQHVRKIHRIVNLNDTEYYQSALDGFTVAHAAKIARSNIEKRRWKQESSLAKTLFAHFALVLALWGQYAFIIIFDFNNRLPGKLHAASIQIAHSIAVFNVFIYLFNPSFRSGMKTFLFTKLNQLILRKRPSINSAFNYFVRPIPIVSRLENMSYDKFTRQTRTPTLPTSKSKISKQSRHTTT